MRSSNPVLTRLGDVTRQSRAATTADYDLGGYTVAKPYNYSPPAERTMTIDDVAIRTVALLVLTGVTGAISWALLPDGATMFLALLGASIAGFALAMVICFARVTNPAVIGAYAVVEGVLLGVVSRWFESRFPGIVIQAVIGTFGIFLTMAVLFRMRVLRATPRFTRVVIGALIGVVLLSIANFVAYLFHVNLGLRDYGTSGQVGWLPIVFSGVVIVVGALTFILDFEMIESGVRSGVPERFAWYCAFGLLVGLIFVYWEVLRMLSYLRR